MRAKKTLVAVGLALVACVGLGAQSNDLNTLLTQFLSDLRAGTLGVSWRISSIGLASGGPGTAVDTTITDTAAGKISLTGTTPMIQLGGTSNSFPALKRSGTQIQSRVADDSGFADLVGLNISANAATSGYYLGTGPVLFTSAVAPTMGACGSSPSIVANNGTAAFRIQVGNAAATTCVVNLPTATTGWVMHCQELVAPATATGDFIYRQTATSTTSATLSFYNNAGTLTAPTNNANFLCSATAY